MHRVRLVTFALTALVVVAANAPTAANADQYKWCAIYAEPIGATNCGFVTLQQCRETVSGIGGTCELSPYYTGPDEERVKHPRRTRKPAHRYD
jgi:Protein of unknown function (DUF3551)